jgi:hypothetical protein
VASGTGFKSRPVFRDYIAMLSCLIDLMCIVCVEKEKYRIEQKKLKTFNLKVGVALDPK